MFKSMPQPVSKTQKQPAPRAPHNRHPHGHPLHNHPPAPENAMPRRALAFFILLALLAFPAPSPAAAQDEPQQTPPAAAQDAPATEQADPGRLAAPRDVLPSRSFLIPQDRDLPHTAKRPWARPHEHGRPARAPGNVAGP